MKSFARLRLWIAEERFSDWWLANRKHHTEPPQWRLDQIRALREEAQAVPLIPWYGLAIIFALFALAFGVSGCAAAPTSPNYQPIIIQMPDPDRTCRNVGSKAREDMKILGCADYMGRIAQGFCVVFVGYNAPQWVIEHELRHCREGAFH